MMGATSETTVDHLGRSATIPQLAAHATERMAGRVSIDFTFTKNKVYHNTFERTKVPYYYIITSTEPKRNNKKS